MFVGGDTESESRFTEDHLGVYIVYKKWQDDSFNAATGEPLVGKRAASVANILYTTGGSISLHLAEAGKRAVGHETQRTTQGNSDKTSLNLAKDLEPAMHFAGPSPVPWFPVILVAKWLELNEQGWGSQPQMAKRADAHEM